MIFRIYNQENYIKIAVTLSKIFSFSSLLFARLSSKSSFKTVSPSFSFSLYLIYKTTLVFPWEVSKVSILSFNKFFFSNASLSISQKPSHPKRINWSPFLLYSFVISGLHVTALSKGCLPLFLNRKSPKPLETLSSPLILLPIKTCNPFFLILYFSSALLGLWSFDKG